jgi:hypothetical protein
VSLTESAAFLSQSASLPEPAAVINGMMHKSIKTIYFIIILFKIISYEINCFDAFVHHPINHCCRFWE